ncbi:MAG: efflux RND transporter permease subunit [Pseudomonadales bacterium]|nr:efflux RND transporter permease subunit [Pseudomonadales bacterium]
MKPNLPSSSLATPHSTDLIGRFAQHKVAANLLMMIMLIAGVYGLSKLNRQFFPTFATDFITVRVIWPGASAEDVARSITTPLEQELLNLDSVKEMRSTSTRGVSSIFIEYQEDTDMGLALDQVKEFVGLVRNLPSDSEEPEITKIVRNEDVAKIVVATSGPLDELRPLVHNFERELLDKGIAKVNFVGLPEQEVAIEVASEQLKTLNLSLNQIGERIAGQSQDIPAGAVGQDEAAREVRSLEKRRSVQGFEELTVITTSDGRRVTVEDIADVHFRTKENGVEVFYQGLPAVLMELKRTETSDTLESARIMHEWLAETRERMPENLILKTVDERYTFVEQRISLLLKNGLGGLVLVVSILFIFLNGRVAFWVAFGIPVSFMGTLAIMHFSGGTINMVSLFALIMALGIIVDDAIVVAEDALTHYQTGEGSLQAAEGGARRMFVPVMSSSMTTIAAFLPLMLVSGIIGNILGDIPFVVICVIVASLIESFLILPGHLRHSFHKNHHKQPGPVRQKLDNLFNQFRDGPFRAFITLAMRYRGVTMVTALSLLVLAFSLVVFKQIKFHFFPQPESSMVIASVKFAAGTPPDTVRSFAFEMERALQEANKKLKIENTLVEDKTRAPDLVESSFVRLNSATFNGGQNYQTGDQYAMIFVELIMPDERSIRNPDLIQAWKQEIVQPSGIEQLSINSPQGGPPGRDIDIFLTGGDAQTLKQAAEELAEAMKVYDGVTNILDDLPYGKQQYIFKLTPLGESLGLTVANVGSQLRAALDGRLLQIFYDENEEIEVRIMLPERERHFHRILETLPIVTPGGDTAPLSNIIALESRKGLELLRHTDGKLGVHITAEVDSSVTNANEVLQKLQQSVIPDLTSRFGLTVKYKGKAEEESQTGKDMGQGAILALLMIYLILAWVFSSYTWPFAVMLAIPFGIAGAFFGHWFMGIDLTILSQFGIFGLSGIVINDSIILITFYKQLRQEGTPAKTALIDAACLRLRAVLLTSLTTIAGLLPLLFETSLQAQFLIPMAVSISFGLAFATLLVLVVVPIMLSYIESANDFINRLRNQPVHNTPPLDTETSIISTKPVDISVN